MGWFKKTKPQAPTNSEAATHRAEKALEETAKVWAEINKVKGDAVHDLFAEEIVQMIRERP